MVVGPNISIGRAAFAVLVVWVLGAAPALAQATPPRPVRTPAATRPAASAPARTGECAQLPGGRAPVRKIADLTTALSPRDLDLVYFGKPLADLTDADFEQIAVLSKRCGQGEDILPPEKLEKFEIIVREAQRARQATLDKIMHQMTDIAALPVVRDRLIRLNGLSESLPLLEPSLTRGDLKYAASWISKQTQTLYDAAPKGELAPAGASAANLPLPPAATSGETAARAHRQRIPGGEDE